LIYPGHWPVSALYINSAILNRIR